MTDYLGKIFFTLFPSKPKHISTPEGKNLRKMLGMFMILHIFFFIASLTAMGFVPMLSELGFIIWTFSCYLTLREWEIIMYFVALTCGTIYGLLNLFSAKNISLLFYILNEIFYFSALYFGTLAYKDFRMSGGIHGTNGRTRKGDKKKKSLTLKENLMEQAD